VYFSKVITCQFLLICFVVCVCKILDRSDTSLLNRSIIYYWPVLSVQNVVILNAVTNNKSVRPKQRRPTFLWKISLIVGIAVHIPTWKVISVAYISVLSLCTLLIVQETVDAQNALRDSVSVVTYNASEENFISGAEQFSHSWNADVA